MDFRIGGKHAFKELAALKKIDDRLFKMSEDVVNVEGFGLRRGGDCSIVIVEVKSTGEVTLCNYEHYRTLRQGKIALNTCSGGQSDLPAVPFIHTFNSELVTSGVVGVVVIAWGAFLKYLEYTVKHRKFVTFSGEDVQRHLDTWKGDNGFCDFLVKVTTGDVAGGASLRPFYHGAKAKFNVIPVAGYNSKLKGNSVKVWAPGLVDFFERFWKVNKVLRKKQWMQQSGNVAIHVITDKDSQTVRWSACVGRVIFQYTSVMYECVGKGINNMSITGDMDCVPAIINQFHHGGESIEYIEIKEMQDNVLRGTDAGDTRGKRLVFLVGSDYVVASEPCDVKLRVKWGHHDFFGEQRTGNVYRKVGFYTSDVKVLKKRYKYSSTRFTDVGEGVPSSVVKSIIQSKTGRVENQTFVQHRGKDEYEPAGGVTLEAVSCDTHPQSLCDLPGDAPLKYPLSLCDLPDEVVVKYPLMGLCVAIMFLGCKTLNIELFLNVTLFKKSCEVELATAIHDGACSNISFLIDVEDTFFNG